jgi:hypothetical protein
MNTTTRHTNGLCDIGNSFASFVGIFDGSCSTKGDTYQNDVNADPLLN